MKYCVLVASKRMSGAPGRARVCLLPRKQQGDSRALLNASRGFHPPGALITSTKVLKRIDIHSCVKVHLSNLRGNCGQFVCLYVYMHI